MIEKKKYICEICGTEYADKCMCQKCEQGHKKPKKIRYTSYKSINVIPNGYPIKITVEFEDGSTKEYKP